MKKLLLVLFAAVSINTAMAGQYGDALSKCLANSVTVKDRTDLARWVFSVISVHPDVTDISSATPEKRDQINQTTGHLVTRLFAACGKEFKDAEKYEGAASSRAAFSALGRLAMQELMSNQKVSEEFRGFMKYADLKNVKTELK